MRIFVSSEDGVYESVGDVNSSDSRTPFKVNRQAIFKNAARIAAGILMVAPLLPMFGGIAGVGVVKAVRVMLGKFL